MGVEVCPVHRSEFKSSDYSSIHEAAMNAEGPRGIKRSVEDDEVEGFRLRPETHNERKDLISEAWKKMNTHCLRKQVLLSNFVRAIHLAMERDGILVPDMFDENNRRRGPHIPAWSLPSRTNSSTLDSPPSNSFSDSPRPDSPAVISHRDVGNGESDFPPVYDRCMMDCESKTNFNYDNLDNSALFTDESDRLSRLNWCSVFTTTFSNSDCTSDYISDDSSSSTSTLHTLMPAAIDSDYFDITSSAQVSSDSPTESTSSAPGSSPTSSEDEIFSDVDLTLYDYDCHAMSPPNVGMDPLTADELVWSLSHDQRQNSSSDRDFTPIST